jgi:U3 small nucleolar RNA-associated protein MPP10
LHHVNCHFHTSDVSISKEFTLPSELQEKVQSLSEHLDQPHDFIGATSPLQQQLKTICKLFYDYSKTVELVSMKASPLSELAVEGFDYEQIWEELQLQNVPALKWLDRKMKELEQEELDFNVSDVEEDENEVYKLLAFDFR